MSICCQELSCCHFFTLVKAQRKTVTLHHDLCNICSIEENEWYHEDILRLGIYIHSQQHRDVIKLDFHLWPFHLGRGRIYTRRAGTDANENTKEGLGVNRNLKVTSSQSIHLVPTAHSSPSRKYKKTMAAEL
jgi:hypothetical protein